MQVKRVEKHIIYDNNPHFHLLKEFCHLGKNLYNSANYKIRQEFIKDDTRKFLGYGVVNKLCRDEENPDFNDYKRMPTAQMAQQILRKLNDNWSSFFKAIKDWRKHPDKYTGRPKTPKYLDKDGETTIYLTNQNCKLRDDGYIHFPQAFNDFKICSKCYLDENFVSFQQVQIKPHKSYLECFVIYNVDSTDLREDNGRYLFIDLGVDNFATVVNNFGQPNLLIDGKGLKSKNQWFNKIIAKVQSSLKVINDLDNSRKLDKLWLKRNNVIMDELHKISRRLVNYAVEMNVSKVVIGHNKGQKDSSQLSKKANQNFVQIPHAKFIELLKYKLNSAGIELIEVEESYTSKCSFLDFDKLPKYSSNAKSEPKFSGKRVHRGLYKSGNGILINADVNGAYNIGRKAQKQLKSNLKDLSKRVEWLVSSPVRLKLS